MKTSRGFTIIELLVVIAIIAVLAAVVMVNVTGYIAKGRDAAIRANLASVITNGAQYFDDNPGNFGDDFVAAPIVTAAKAAITAAKGTPAGSGDDDTQAWCMCSTLASASTKVTCVDSTGLKVNEKTSDCATTCPAAGACVP